MHHLSLKLPKVSRLALRPLLVRCSMAMVACLSLAMAQAQDRFPFVVPGEDATKTITDQSQLLHRPAGKHGFVAARDGHFYLGQERFRMWGVNLCFAANFPTHAEAEVLAPHLAKLGVNAVRFHHMDSQDAPNGIWKGGDANGQRQLSPEMIDRLDYFLAQLHEHGIYADINLHVSRELTPKEGFPVVQSPPWWGFSNKYVMYYDPDVQSELKRYSRELLTHVNPYRKLRRADDPGIAVVEMLNENYFSQQGYGLVSKLPERFQVSLRTKWNAWLKEQYGDTATLIKAWGANEKGIGSAMVKAAQWTTDLEGWIVTKSESDLPRAFNVESPSQLASLRAIRFTPLTASDQDYHQQLIHQSLSTLKDDPLTLEFWVRADKPRKVKVELSASPSGEWRELGLFEEIVINDRWQKITRVVSAKETHRDQAYVAFSFGNDVTPIEFAGIQLFEGSPKGEIPSGQTLESNAIAIPGTTFPSMAHADMKRFMVDTERSWIREFRQFIQGLGVRVPITASQINYHAPGIVESELDFADLHNYWHHPMFPAGRDWSATEWTVGNQPMEASPTYSKWPANSLLMRCGWRVDGLPMTVTEWNYPEPSMYSAGCVPMAAALGALQDWDGIFFFDYEAFMFVRDDDRPYTKKQTNNFFSFNGAPAKLTSLSLFANVFLRGDLAPLESRLVSSPASPLDGRLAMQHRLSVRSNATGPAPTTIPNGDALETPDRSLSWHVDQPDQKGTLRIQTPKTMGVWGTIANQSFDVGGMKWNVSQVDPDYGILVASSMDDQPISQSKRIVLLAATNTINQGMKWNEQRTSVGTDWGHAPTQAVAINASVEIPYRFAKAKVSALDGTGRAMKVVPSTVRDNVLRFEIGDTYQTMWYAIEADSTPSTGSR